MRGLLEEKASGQECRRDVLDILGGYAACAEMIPPSLERRDHLFDCLPGRFIGQSEPLHLRKQVVDTRRAAVCADCHRQVAALKADHRGRYEIVGRRQAPAARCTAHRVIARVVVVVGDGCVEDDAAEELDAIFVRLLRPAAQFIGEQGIGPALAVEIVLVAVEQGERADEPEAEIAALRVDGRNARP